MNQRAKDLEGQIMETAISKTDAAPTLAGQEQAITQESYDQKKVTINFRDREINSQPCMSIVSSLLTLVPGSEKSGPEQNTAGNDHVPVPRSEGHDIRLETINYLTAMIEHDQYLDFKDRCYLQLAIEVIGSASMKQDLEDSQCGGA